MSPRKPDELTLEYVLLGLVAQQPSHGYLLSKTLQERRGIGLIWRLRQSRLYALLDKLEGLGLLESRSAAADPYPQRKQYHLSQAGRAALEQWLQQPVHAGRQMRQEFVAKLYLAGLERGEAVMHLIDRQRCVCRGWLDKLSARREDCGPERAFERIVYEFRIRQVQAMLDWLDDCQRQLLSPSQDAG